MITSHGDAARLDVRFGDESGAGASSLGLNKPGAIRGKISWHGCPGSSQYPAVLYLSMIFDSAGHINACQSQTMLDQEFGVKASTSGFKICHCGDVKKKGAEKNV